MAAGAVGPPQVLHALPQHLPPLQGILQIGVTEQQPKFAVSQASQQIGRAQFGAQQLGDLGEGPVAGVMSPVLIDQLEVVDVEQQQGERFAAVAAAL